MTQINDLLVQNKKWAKQMLSQDPDFFARLEHQQRPKFLWIGCSDSRVPANQITDLPPGQVFVHRNIANQVIHTDFNALSVIQYAIESLEVEHIIVCGHYNCSGIHAAMGQERNGFVDNWLRHIKDIRAVHERELSRLPSVAAREDRLTELNVMHQVVHLAESSFVEQAWAAGRSLSIHGWAYSLTDGLIRDLGVTMTGGQDLEPLLERLRIVR